MTQDNACARRTFMKGAGLGLGLGWIAPAAPALAQTVPADAAAPLWSGEYWAKKGEVPLYLYRKRAGAPAPGEKRPVLFLVHGSSISGRSSFDLSVPGKGEYSLMNVFARQGFDVWTMDHENYGRSGRTAGNSDIASGVEDLRAGTEIVRRETGAERMHFAGTSSGAIRAGAFAAKHPERVDRLVLAAFTYTGEGSPTLKRRAERTAEYRANNRRKRDRAMIRSIFTRDGANVTDPAVAEALDDAELQFGGEVPTGTYLDMTANLPLVDPAKVTAPVLLIRGDHDGIATLDDIVSFMKKLPNGDRQLTILPDAAHSLTFDRNRHRFWHTIHAFLNVQQLAKG